jgi:hypothetical protein
MKNIGGEQTIYYLSKMFYNYEWVHCDRKNMLCFGLECKKTNLGSCLSCLRG